MTKEQLYGSLLEWEEDGRRDPRDSYPYMNVLRDIDFHASTRFEEYRQFVDQDGPFGIRLLRWIENVTSDPERKSLLKLLSRICFVDREQMNCLYRDAFRRIIVPWLLAPQSIEDRLNKNRPTLITERLQNVTLFTITESMQISEFLNSNDLLTSKPTVLGDDETVARRVAESMTMRSSIIVLEDFVGSGRQALKILKVLAEVSGPQTKILFIPMIMLHSGFASFSVDLLPRVIVDPVHVVPLEDCIAKEVQSGEQDEHGAIRAIVLATQGRVLLPSGATDDPPRNPFGYSSSGALVVTAHNVPNNTLPLIHHQNDGWRALFRRLHHPKPSVSQGGSFQ